MSPSQVLFVSLCMAHLWPITEVSQDAFSRPLDIVVKRGVNGNVSYITGEYLEVPRGVFQFHLGFDGYGENSTRPFLLSFTGAVLSDLQQDVAYLSLVNYLIEVGTLKADMSLVRDSMHCGFDGEAALREFDRIDHAAREYVEALERAADPDSAQAAAILLNRIAKG